MRYSSLLVGFFLITAVAACAKESNAVNAYTPRHLEGFIIGRTDWE